MNRDCTWRMVLIGIVLALAAACGSKKPQPPEVPDGTGGEDAGTEDAGVPGPEITSFATYGGFILSPARAFLHGSSTTFIGMQGMALDPAVLGRPAVEGSYQGWLTPGLLAVDTTTGKVRLYTSADGLPKMEYVTVEGSLGEHTVSVFGLAWIERDLSFVAAAWDHVVRGQLQDGAWKFTSAQLQSDVHLVKAKSAHVAVAGGEVFVGTDQGVAVLDPATLAVKRWVELGVSVTGPWVAGLSAGEVDGAAAVGVVFGPAESPPTQLALVRPGEATATLFPFADGSVPLSVYGMQGRMLVGAQVEDGRGAIYAIGASTGGLALEVMVSADGLSASSLGFILPVEMAWDDSRSKLVVGGQLLPSGGGGGLVQLTGNPDGTIFGTAQEFIPASDPYSKLLPLIVDALSFDGAGRLYVAGKQLCSEHKTRQLPVYRVERDAQGEPRMVKPFVTGVRDIEKDPVNGNTWLALRDDNGGLQCDGIPVGQGLCRLRADGACEIVPVVTNDDSPILVTPGVIDVAFGAVDQKELALATLDEASWVRRVETGRQVMTQLDPKVSLDMTAAAFGAPGELWLGSQADWHSYPGMDEDAIDRRSPHGLGLLELDAEVRATSTRRYVRAKSDLTGLLEIEGLPSNTVWAVMPLPGARTALVALGVERSLTSYDHLLGTPAPTGAKGGVALVEDMTVTAFAPPEGGAFSDVMALARGKDGTVYAVDSELGVLRLDLAAHTAAVWAAPPWTAPERPLSLAADGTGLVAVGTTRALYVFDAGAAVTAAISGGSHGYVWRLRFDADGVLWAGTDQGFVQLAVAGATPPPALGPASYAGRDLWPLAKPCGGVDGCACTVSTDCAEKYACVCDKENACQCLPEDPCVGDPGGRGCACDPSAPACNKGMLCECNAVECTCQLDPANCANGACPCAESYECPTDWYCNQGAGSCAERQKCDADCSCATASGCSPGLRCQSGVAGKSCI